MQETIEKRTKRSKTFDLGGGKFRLETGKHSHTQKNGLWLPTDTRVEVESGTDASVGMNYISRSRFENLDYDIRFGKNDPVWMKIKHIPTNKTVVFKPRNNNNRPDHVVAGNKIFVSRAWDGIDMEIFVTDKGTKTNYIIKSPAGQRVVEFNVSGDVLSFRVGRPWYNTEGRIPVFVPVSFSSGVMAYDFRQVPVGTVVDPTVSADQADVWTVASESASVNIADLASGEGASFFSYFTDTQTYAGHNFNGALYLMRRGWRRFDCSAVPAGATIENASLEAVGYGSENLSADYNYLKVYAASDMTPGQNKATYQNVGAVLSDAVAYVGSESVGTEQTLTFALNSSGVTPGGNTVLAMRHYCDYTPQDFTYGLYNNFAADFAQGSTLSFDYKEDSGVLSPTFGAGKQYPFARGRSWR